MKKMSVIALLVVIALFGCKKESNDNGGTSYLKVNLTDAPALYDEVNVEVTGLQVIIDDAIIDLPVNGGVYNLLDFVNGKDTLCLNPL